MHSTLPSYDPAPGQFLSPDTLVPDAGLVLDYNRYMYVRGNPLKYTDPSGHIAVCFQGGPDSWFKSEDEVTNSVCSSGLEAAGYEGEYKYYVSNGHWEQQWARQAIKNALAQAEAENRFEPVILIGHSWGGSAVRELANLLNEDGITVDAAIVIEYVPRQAQSGIPDFPDNINSLYNIYAVDGWSRNTGGGLPQQNGGSGEWNMQNGVNEVPGAKWNVPMLAVDVEGSTYRMDHQRVINATAGDSRPGVRDTANPVTISLIGLMLRDSGAIR